MTSQTGVASVNVARRGDDDPATASLHRRAHTR